MTTTKPCRKIWTRRSLSHWSFYVFVSSCILSTASFQLHLLPILTKKSFLGGDGRLGLSRSANQSLNLQRRFYTPSDNVNSHIQMAHNTTESMDSNVVSDHIHHLPHSSQSLSAIAAIEAHAPTTTFPTSITSHLDTKHILNAILLVICFSFVSYTVFNVDHGMTRGWTLEETAMRIPLDNWASYESSLNTQPVVTKTMINVIIYLLGDWASQTIFVKKNIVDFDALRTFRNGFIGLCFGPLVHQYYEFSDSILPVEVGINRLYKICMDQTIYLAVKCSVYIMAVNILSGETFDTAKTKVQDKLTGIMFTAWKFWPLVHLVTYNVIPARHRILWVNCVDLVWNAILSLRTNSDTKDTDKMIAVDSHETVVPCDDLKGEKDDGEDENLLGELNSLNGSTGNVNENGLWSNQDQVVHSQR